jgi:thioredoxin 1
MVLESEGTSRVGVIDSDQMYEENVERSSGWVLVDYFAEWCGPCKRFSPTLSRLSCEFTNINFFKVDVEQLDDKAQDANIQAMPTFVLYRDGEEVGRVTGADQTKLTLLLQRTL